MQKRIKIYLESEGLGQTKEIDNVGGFFLASRGK